MRTARSGGFLLAAMLAMAATPGSAMPVARAPMAADANVVTVQFLGGPFFGRYGYYQADPAKRHYFYDGFDPSLYPYKKRFRRHYHVRRKVHRH